MDILEAIKQTFLITLFEFAFFVPIIIFVLSFIYRDNRTARDKEFMFLAKIFMIAQPYCFFALAFKTTIIEYFMYIVAIYLLYKLIIFFTTKRKPRKRVNYPWK